MVKLIVPKESRSKSKIIIKIPTIIKQKRRQTTTKKPEKESQ
jgi:hypothetical protein